MAVLSVPSPVPYGSGYAGLGKTNGLADVKKIRFLQDRLAQWTESTLCDPHAIDGRARKVQQIQKLTNIVVTGVATVSLR
jgi:hypothetical protein